MSTPSGTPKSVSPHQHLLLFYRLFTLNFNGKEDKKILCAFVQKQHRLRAPFLVLTEDFK